MKIMILVMAAISLLAGGTCQAAVWHVERDGSGDFVVIQDAVDAAESGDTILIGPGRYPETGDFDYYGRTIQACISLDKSLTILGSGRDATIIGPDSGLKNEYGTEGLGCISANLTLRMEDLTFIDCDGNCILFDMDYGGRLMLERVDVQYCYSGVSIHGTSGSYIRNCNISVRDGGDGVLFLNVHGADISGCNIESQAGGINIQFPGSSGISIADCSLSGGHGGIALSTCGSVSIDNCDISNVMLDAIVAGSTEGVQISNVIACENVFIGIDLANNEGLLIQNSVFQGSFASVVIGAQVPHVMFRNNHILQIDDGYWAWVAPNYTGPPIHFDLTHNYWGTTDPDEISAGIYDAYDDDSRHVFVDFEPMADGPVSTESTTWGQLKALYR